MNIAIFTDAFLPQLNGVVSYVIDTATELVERKHKILIFAPKPRRGMRLDLSTFPFEVILLPSIPAFFYPDFRITIPYSPKVLLKLKKFKADIIHIQSPMMVGNEGFIAARLMKIPSVITFHTFFLDEDMLKNIKMWRLVSKFRKPLWHLTSRYYNLADVVTCPSNVAKRELVKNGLRKPIIVINNGIDLKQIRTFEREDILNKRRQYNINASDQVGIYVGRIAADKCLDVLINAWKMVVATLPKAKLLLVGSGPWERNLKGLIKELGLENGVIMTGYVDRGELFKRGLYALADIFVIASTIETQSLSLVEAMAHKLPVVGVAARAIPEFVDESCGILVSPHNPFDLAKAIIKIFSDKKLKIKLSQGAYRKSRNFDIVKTTSQIEGVYKGLLNG